MIAGIWSCGMPSASAAICLRVLRSLPQMPVNSGRTSSWPGAGDGSGRVRMVRVFPCRTAARMIRVLISAGGWLHVLRNLRLAGVGGCAAIGDDDRASHIKGGGRGGGGNRIGHLL